MRSIQRVAVLGSGTMGSRIAALFANAGVRVLLLDLPAQDSGRNALARKGIETALKQKPTAFFTQSAVSLIEPGNFEDDLERLRECQWVIEAVAENLDIKRELWVRVSGHLPPEAIASTNTSGIPLAEISRDFPEDVKRRFLGTHFFNPPRYLHLLEVIPIAETSQDLLEFVKHFGETHLGKGIVTCKDTPNFIANRIGSFFGAAVVRAMSEGEYTVEEVDALTGPLIGLPKSATFRLFDIVGLDVWASVSKNLYENAQDDPWRDWFLAPEFLTKLVERGWVGEKSGQGFYRRVGPDRQIQAIDLKTFEYHPAVMKPDVPGLAELKKIPDLCERLRKLVLSGDRAGSFVWSVFKHVFAYSAAKVGEISDRIVEIDRAMRWGYGHQLGPFELWDALGFRETAERMEAQGIQLPASIQNMLQEGIPSFYRPADHIGFPRTEYFDFTHRAYVPLESRPAIVLLSEIKRARGVIESNGGASLLDLGDGVVCLEFHSKMNAIGDEALQMFVRGTELLSDRFEAMVIANEGENFSAGANLFQLLTTAQAGNFEAISKMIGAFQQCMLRLKYAPKPVVAAAFARALGGGCEVVLQSHRVQASAETYMGLVEAGVGLIPAAGGCKEMLLRFEKDPSKAFEIIGQAKVSGSAAEAMEIGYLRGDDRVSINPEFLIGDAKRFALELAKTYRQGTPRTDVAVTGDAGYAKMRLAAWSLQESGFISEHDFTIAEKLARVLSGGRVTAGTLVSENYLLELERESFLSLIAMQKTQDRIQYMLKQGKPLRN